MPMFVLNTNVEESKVTDAFLSSTSKLVAELLGKPEGYVYVQIEAGKSNMMFGGSKDVCGYAELSSIGALGGDKNKTLSSKLSHHLHQHLGIPNDRMYIKFTDLPRPDVGFKSRNMKLTKPGWINHDGSGIYSIDCHPSEQRFATGGQSDNRAGLIVIWNLLPVIDIQAEINPSIPKALCRIEQYACVNVVRWSKSGKYLASAGDERAVSIWHYAGRSTGMGTFGSGKPANVEQWKCQAQLKAHTGDVLHVEWSPKDRYLASCSVDNSIVIWNGQRFGEQIATLSSHTDMVKGVSWDPIGRYLASQSSDKTLKIWATSNWDCIKTITKPFTEASNTTHVLRLGWSPNGQMLISAHAMNNGGPTAQLIHRKGWDTSKDFVGHRKAISCVRWGNGLFEKVQKHKDKTKTNVGSCFATGSRDRTLAVWHPLSFSRPLTVLKNIFSQGILDITWSGDGFQMLACSSDGSACCISFSASELGRPLTQQETEDQMKELYGKVPTAVGSGDGSCLDRSFSGTCDIVDNPAVLKAQQEYSQKLKARQSVTGVTTEKEIQKENSRPTPVSTNTTSTAVSTTQPPTPGIQMETKTKEGKRRIQPLFLGSATVAQPTRSGMVESGEFGGLSLKRAAMDDGGVEKRFRPSLPIRIPPSSFALPPPIPQQSLSQTFTRQVGIGTETFIVSVENEVAMKGTLKIAKVTCLKKKNPVWETAVGCRISKLAVSSQLVCVGCEDRTVRVFSTASGTLTTSPLVLDSSISVLSCTGWFIMAVTVIGSCFVWDWRQKKTIIQKESLAPLLSDGKDVTITSGVLTEQGVPIVTLSDGKAFTFSTSFGTWMLLCVKNDPLARVSGGKGGLLDTMSSMETDGPLSLLTRGETLHPYSTTAEAMSGVSFLETRLQAAVALSSSKEYTFWLHQYVEHLTRIGSTEKLKELLQDLLGPQFKSRPEKDAQVLGMKKADLLTQVLPIVAQNPQLQKLYTEFSDELQSTYSSVLF